MTLPLSDRNEYIVSSIGSERYPQSLVVKNSLWTLQLTSSRLLLKDFEGQSFLIQNLFVKNYSMSQVVNSSGIVNTDRFWVWVVDLYGVLSLYEYEPYTTSQPIVIRSIIPIGAAEYSSNVNNVSTFINGAIVRVVVLYNNDTLKMLSFKKTVNPVPPTDFFENPDPPIITDLNWSATRSTEYGHFTDLIRSKLSVTYLNPSSPFNVYIESYTVDAPENFQLVQDIPTNTVNLTWDAASGADEYYIEKDTDPLFSSPVALPTTTELFYNDTVDTRTTYYYRVKGRNSELLLESIGATEESIVITSQITYLNFSSDVISGIAPLDVTFDYEVISTFPITSWLWDFGDGTTSTVDRPDHQFIRGTYKVKLTVSDGYSELSDVGYMSDPFPPAGEHFQGTAIVGNQVWFSNSQGISVYEHNGNGVVGALLAYKARSDFGVYAWIETLCNWNDQYCLVGEAFYGNLWACEVQGGSIVIIATYHDDVTATLFLEVVTDGTYIYANSINSDYEFCLSAYSFDGTVFTQLAVIVLYYYYDFNIQSIVRLICYNGFLYITFDPTEPVVPDPSTGLWKLSFNGSTFTFEEHYSSPGYLPRNMSAANGYIFTDNMYASSSADRLYVFDGDLNLLHSGYSGDPVVPVTYDTDIPLVSFAESPGNTIILTKLQPNPDSTTVVSYSGSPSNIFTTKQVFSKTGVAFAYAGDAFYFLYDTVYAPYKTIYNYVSMSVEKQNYIDSYTTETFYISTIEELQTIGTPGDATAIPDPILGFPLHGNYVQSNNIDASDTSTWNDGLGFVPIACYINGFDSPDYIPYNSFSGSYDGNGFSITNLFIDRSTKTSEVGCGLFAYFSEATLSNILLIDVDVTSALSIGAIAGEGYDGLSTINNCRVTGTINGSISGGLIGKTNCELAISNCFNRGTVSGTNIAGGFIGEIGGLGTIQKCYAECNVSGQGFSGGFSGKTNGVTDASVSLISCFYRGTVTCSGDSSGTFSGYLSNCTLLYCYSLSSVLNSMCDISGGFVGSTGGGSTSLIEQCFIYGVVIANNGGICGGFVGDNSIPFLDCFCQVNITYIASISIENHIAGFVGRQDTQYEMNNCYCSGTINGTGIVENIGGFAASLIGIVTSVIHSYWDREISGQITSAAGEGKTTAEMKIKGVPYVYVDWDFDTVWYMNDHTF